MKQSFLKNIFRLVLIGIISMVLTQCSKKEKKTIMLEPKFHPEEVSLNFDSTQVAVFYEKYPKLKLYKERVDSLYHKNNFTFVWYDTKRRKEIGDVLFNKINNLAEEGVPSTVPYLKDFKILFEKKSPKTDLSIELFLTTYYYYYTQKVLRGLDADANVLEWYLPRNKQGYTDYLDSLLVNPKLIENNKKLILQYYKLKDMLQCYRDLEKKGGWKKIKVDEDFEGLYPGDSSEVVLQIRNRLFLTDDIPENSKSNVYDEVLQNGVLKFQKRNGFSPSKVIFSRHIAEMNVPVSERIKTIIVNMERCRWVSKNVTNAKEYILVNIPSFQLTYYKKGKVTLVSNVVVGTALNKTVIFSGKLSYIVFSPYWNVPESIKENEILPALKMNKNYLEEHHMEWYNKDYIRQKPGPKNALGLIKFLFPNNNNIYLHDTPSKELFNKETRAFSHGCIRVAKPVELANLILEEDENWTPEKIEEAMNKGEESWYSLKRKVPVHVGYFTAWVDDEGIINFYKDIYKRDNTLLSLLMEQ